MKSPEQRGVFGAWLVAQRERLSTERGRKLRQDDIVAELAQAGFPLDSSYYRALEGGSKKPGREMREGLAKFFGRTPPPDQPEQGTDVAELVGAIRAQTEAINGLVALLHQREAAPPVDAKTIAALVGEMMEPRLRAARRGAGARASGEGATRRQKAAAKAGAGR